MKRMKQPQERTQLDPKFEKELHEVLEKFEREEAELERKKQCLKG